MNYNKFNNIQVNLSKQIINLLKILKNKDIKLYNYGLHNFYLNRINNSNSIFNKTDINLAKLLCIKFKNKNIKILELGGGICQLSILLKKLGYTNIYPTEINALRMDVFNYLNRELNLNINTSQMNKDLWKIDWNNYDLIIFANIGWDRNNDNERLYEYNIFKNYIYNNGKMIYSNLCDTNLVQNKINNNELIFTCENHLSNIRYSELTKNKIDLNYPIFTLISKNIKSNLSNHLTYQTTNDTLNNIIDSYNDIKYNNLYLIFEDIKQLFSLNKKYLDNFKIGILLNNSYKNNFINVLIKLIEKYNILFVILDFNINELKLEINKIKDLNNIFYKQDNKIINIKNKKEYLFTNLKNEIPLFDYINNNFFFVIDIYYNKNLIKKINNLNKFLHFIKYDYKDYEIINNNFIKIDENIKNEENNIELLKFINFNNIKNEIIIQNNNKLLKLIFINNKNSSAGVYLPICYYLNNLEEKIHKCKITFDVKIENPDLNSKIKIYTGIKWFIIEKEITNTFQTIEFINDFNFFRSSTYRIGFINIESNILYLKNIKINLIL